jgi:hypothetical protein
VNDAAWLLFVGALIWEAMRRLLLLVVNEFLFWWTRR